MAIIIIANACDNQINVIAVSREGHFIFEVLLHNVKMDYD